MSPSALTNLLNLVGTSRDNALLRFSLGSEYLKAGDWQQAELHLREALQRDPDYSAAWKLLARAVLESGREQEALDIYRRGIAVAEARGDKQAAREMAVFAKRIEKKRAPT